MVKRHLALGGTMMALAACSAASPQSDLAVSQNQPSPPVFIASTDVAPIDQTKLLKRLLPDADPMPGAAMSYAPLPSAPVATLASTPRPIIKSPLPATAKSSPTQLAGIALATARPAALTKPPQPVSRPAVIRQPLSPAAAKIPAAGRPAPAQMIEPPLDYTPW